MQPEVNVPFQIIEHTIGFFDGDIPSLATCSLICRDLLPVCRTHIWRDIALPIGARYPGSSTQSPRTAAFLEVIDADPVVALYVHALSLDLRYSDGSAEIRGHKRRNRTTVYEVLIAIARDFPLLEALHLENANIEDQDGGERGDLRSLATSTNRARWALKKLAIVEGLVPATLLSELVAFLGQSADLVSLQSLDLRSPILSRDSILQVWPNVLPFASSLLHLGIALNDVGPVELQDVSITPFDKVYKHRIERVLSTLPQCGSLQSLCLQYDLFESFFLVSYTNSDNMFPASPPIPSPSFLDLFSDVLSAPGEHPLRCLERLSLVFISPPHWLADFHASFHKLAEALVDGLDDARSDGAEMRKFPRFSRLDVRMSILQTVQTLWGERGIGEYRARWDVVKRDLILPMLAPFARAGVAVEIVLE
ncbi:hypothetical protein BV20DRAFT_1104849 [Pilatotrama ljubarskyi]|nr:hypothetical protein BV20DRAFT_1104849 [Pilatotrama ljubarskyi]